MGDSPRARTLLRLRRLTVAVAATSAVVGVDAEAEEPSAIDGGARANGDADAGAPMPVRDPCLRPEDGGPMPERCYAVVDPLPPPARGCGCHSEPKDVASARRGGRR